MRAENVIVKARTAIMMDYGFFGGPVMKPEYVNDPTCKTLWTDGVRIGYNPDLILKYANQSQVVMFFLVHEVFHIILEHNMRREGRDPKLWGMACDYAVNSMLLDMGFPLPDWVLYSPVYHGKSVEEIYSMLEAEQKEKENSRKLR